MTNTNSKTTSLIKNTTVAKLAGFILIFYLICILLSDKQYPYEKSFGVLLFAISTIGIIKTSYLRLILAILALVLHQCVIKDFSGESIMFNIGLPILSVFISWLAPNVIQRDEDKNSDKS